MGNFINVVSQYERMAVFTLGKFSGMRKPGFHLLFWPIQRQERVDLREEVLDIPRQTNITLDNAPIDIENNNPPKTPSIVLEGEICDKE